MSIASSSTLVKFHEFPSGNVLHNYQPGTQIDGPIRSISWSKDGNWLALVPSCGFAEIISVKDHLKLIHTVQGIEEPSCAAFQNTTKKNIAIGTKNGEVFIYDIKARSVKKRYPRTASVVNRVEFTAKDCHLVAACESGEAYLYSNVHNNLSGTFKIPRSQTISALRTNPIKRNYVVAGSREGVVAVWDIHGNKNKFFIGSHKAPVTTVAFSPINSDLVVSAGLDRQFCFYDITSNKCIGNIFVENSMTSVDFSPDGKFIVMASQKGKIYVYDFKNIQQPVHSFFGHNSSIEHLSFRKSEDYESSFNMSSENIKEMIKNTESHGTTESFDLPFEVDTVNCNEPAKNTSSQMSTVAEDSFMAAMGLDQSNTTESVKPENSMRFLENSKKFALHKFTPTNTTKSLQDRLHSETKTSMMTSTPDCIQNINNLYPTISPIVNLIPQASGDQSRKDFEELEDLIKTTVKGELKSMSEELKNDIKSYSYHTLGQVRDIGYGLLMHMVKESIKLENTINNLRADLTSDIPENQSSLFEENAFLKQRISQLEEELALLKNDQTDNNN